MGPRGERGDGAGVRDRVDVEQGRKVHDPQSELDEPLARWRAPVSSTLIGTPVKTAWSGARSPIAQ